jgi:hypothetical protein
MKDLKIAITCRCRECDGAGIVYNLDWDASRQQMKAWEQENPKPAAPRTPAHPDWADWLDRKTTAQWVIWSELGHDDQPAEELPCPTCEGTGRESVQLTPEALAQHLGIETGWSA